MSHDWAKEAGMEFAENDPNTQDWKDELQPVVESDEKGFFVEDGGEGDVQTTDTYQQKGLVTEVLGVNAADSDSKLNKRSVLMNISDHQHPDGFVQFVRLDEETGEPQDGMNMPEALWEDFGHPETITVVVYPRDMLN